MLNPEQFLKKVAEDKTKLQKAALDYADVIDQHDDLAKKIIAELEQAEADLDTLQTIKNLIEGEGKQNSQYINSLLTISVMGNIPTIKAHVQDARQSIVESKS